MVAGFADWDGEAVDDLGGLLVDVASLIWGGGALTMLQMTRNHTTIQTASMTCCASSRTFPSTVISLRNSRLIER